MASSKSIPAAAMFVAIMNLILYLPCACCSGGGIVFGQAVSDGTAWIVDPQEKKAFEKLNKDLKEKLPQLETIQLISNVAMLIASLDLVVAAVGLLTRQSWGRWLCIGGAVMLIAVTLFNTGYQVTRALPVTLEAQKELMAERGIKTPGSDNMVAFIAYFALAVNVLINVGYAFLALVLMITPAVGKFYSGGMEIDHDADEGWPDSSSRFDDRRREQDR